MDRVRTASSEPFELIFVLARVRVERVFWLRGIGVTVCVCQYILYQSTNIVCDILLLSELGHGDKYSESAVSDPGEVVNPDVEEGSTSSMDLSTVPRVHVHVLQCPWEVARQPVSSRRGRRGITRGLLTIAFSPSKRV